MLRVVVVTRNVVHLVLAEFFIDMMVHRGIVQVKLVVVLLFHLLVDGGR